MTAPIAPDAQRYPKILERVLWYLYEARALRTLVAFRTTCSALRALVDARLPTHFELYCFMGETSHGSALSAPDDLWTRQRLPNLVFHFHTSEDLFGLPPENFIDDVFFECEARTPPAAVRLFHACFTDSYPCGTVVNFGANRRAGYGGRLVRPVPRIDLSLTAPRHVINIPHDAGGYPEGFHFMYSYGFDLPLGPQIETPMPQALVLMLTAAPPGTVRSRNAASLALKGAIGSIIRSLSTNPSLQVTLVGAQGWSGKWLAPDCSDVVEGFRECCMETWDFMDRYCHHGTPENFLSHIEFVSLADYRVRAGEKMLRLVSYNPASTSHSTQVSQVS